MIQPNEMKAVRPMRLHGGAISTTADVWSVLVASNDGDICQVERLAADTPALLTCQYDYTCPFHLAVREGHLELVRFLVERAGIDPNYRMHPFQESLLTCAEDRGHAAVATFLRTSSANPELIRSWDDIGVIERGQDETARNFQKMVNAGQLAAVAAMLRERPSLALDEDMFWGEGILAIPSKNGDREMMELLLRNGARVPPISKWPAEYYFKNLDSAVFLLKAGMDPNHKNWRNVTLLHDLAFRGERQKIELLLDYGAEIDPVDEEFCSTPLGFAARWGQREVVALLVDRGADVNRSGASWASPLVWARRKGHLAIAADLQKAGAK